MQAPTPVRQEQQAPPQHKSEVTKQAPAASETPSVVNNLPATEKQESPKEQSKWWVPPPPWDIYWPTIGLVIASGFAVLFALKTLRAINAQVIEMQETGKQTEKLIAENIAQSTSMQKSVAEAARLSSAMEVVATKIAISTEAAIESVAALKERTARQMRAYLCVNIGGGDYQDRTKNFKFASRPILLNAGHTPAHKVSYKANAAILPVPLPKDFSFPLPDESIGAALLGAQQSASLGAIVDDFCDDKEVEDIKIGKGKVLYIWGIVNYEDVFGESHFTNSVRALFSVSTAKYLGFSYPDTMKRINRRSRAARKRISGRAGGIAPGAGAGAGGNCLPQIV